MPRMAPAIKSCSALLLAALATMSMACTSKPALRSVQAPAPSAEVIEAHGSAIMSRDDEEEAPSSPPSDEPSPEAAKASPKK